MTAAANRDFIEMERIVQGRVDFLHDTINERLELKDRWITDRFAEVDKRLASAVTSLEREVQDLNELMCAEMKGQHEWATMRFEMGAKRFDDYIASQSERSKIIVEGHLEQHKTADQSMAGYKDTIQQRIDQLVKIVETLREERGLFVLRDSHDAKLDALEKSLLALEKTTSERIDATIKQTKEALDSRVQANMDRIVKIEQNLQVMNARNQQSIIALGILLTLVEIIVRFYNS